MNHPQIKIGTIEIRRTKGTEIWDITSGNFSIDKPTEEYRLNFWVESNEKHIQRLDDTGETPVIFEIKLPFDVKPNFDNWIYEYPGYKIIGEKDFGEHGQAYWDNFFYYEHESLENIKMQISRVDHKLYEITIRGYKCDPINWQLGDAEYIISARLELNDSFDSYWLSEE